MKCIPRPCAARRLRAALYSAGASLLLLLLGACSALRPQTTPPPTLYSLDSARPGPVVSAPATAPTLIITLPHAAAGFDSQRILYVRQAHQLEYFANSEWISPPARMLGPRLAAALESTGAFRAVVLSPSAAVSDLRLDTDIIRLQQEFLTRPSRVHFTLRATLLDDKTRRVLVWREFDAMVPAASDDPYGGVVAANLAVQEVLENLASLCAEVARFNSTPSNTPVTPTP